MATIDYFKTLHAKGAHTLSSVESGHGLIDQLQACLADCEAWEVWGNLLLSRGRDSKVILWAVKELRFGAYLAGIGHYRSAFAQIRLFLELGVSSIEFSANELFCRMWHAGNRDMKWSTLVNEKTGIYSQEFCKVFFLELAGEVSTYRALLDTVYSECSSFVHGEAETHLGEDNGFDENLLQKWVDLRSSAHDALLFGFLMRFLRELREDEKLLICSSVRKRFGQLAQIADLLPNEAVA